MAKKTVINRALKQIINTHGDVFVQEADERTEDVDRMEQVEADVAYEIESGANKEEFIVEEPQAIEEKPAPKTVADVTAGAKEKEPVKEEKKQDVPSFMQMEDM